MLHIVPFISKKNQILFLFYPEQTALINIGTKISSEGLEALTTGGLSHCPFILIIFCGLKYFKVLLLSLTIYPLSVNLSLGRI